MNEAEKQAANAAQAYQGQSPHGGGQPGPHGQQGGDGGHAYYCSPLPGGGQPGPGQAPGMGGYPPPPPQYAGGPQMGGHGYPPPPPYPGHAPHPGYMAPPMPAQYGPQYGASAYPPPPHPGYGGYGYSHPYPPPAQQPSHGYGDSGLGSFFNFRDERFLKGAITGAALTFVLTNESFQKNTVKSVLKFWHMLQGGMEEMKERIQDIDAELKAESQDK